MSSYPKSNSSKSNSSKSDFSKFDSSQSDRAEFSEPPEPSVSKLARRGAFWTVGAFGASSLLRFGSNLILTRLLIPELFGLMALVYVFISGLHMFSDVGIGVSIVQNKRGEERDFLNTAWTLQVIRGLLLWLGCLLLAYPASLIYDEPRLLWLMPIVGLSTIISGFNSTAIYSLNRQLAVKELAIFELSGQIISTLVIIVWACFQPTIWAIVAGGLTSCTYQLLLSYRLGKGNFNQFAWEKTAVQEILSFGIWIFVSTAMTFFAEQADKLILGKVLGLSLLGIYGLAMTFADMPRSITNALGGKVVMPALAMIADQPRPAIRAKLTTKRKPLLIVMAVGVAVVACFGDFLIEQLYDSRYHDAAWMLPILIVGIWPRLLCNTIETVLFAVGRPQYTAAANLSRFLCTAVGIWIGYTLFKIPGAVIGVALNDLCYYSVICYGLRREGFSALKHDMLATGLLFCTLAFLLIVRYLLGLGTPIDNILLAG
jgi:O-antigen/teichoic acid export membrane protein